MKLDGTIDIFQTVRRLRTQRPLMVQTEVRIIFPETICLYSTANLSGCADKMHLKRVAFIKAVTSLKHKTWEEERAKERHNCVALGRKDSTRRST